MSNIRITVKDIEETTLLDSIVKQYDEGSDQVYEIENPEGEVVGILTPYDGPYEAKVEETDDGTGDCIVPLPKRLLSKLGIGEGDNLDVTIRDDGSIELSK